MNSWISGQYLTITSPITTPPTISAASTKSESDARRRLFPHPPGTAERGAEDQGHEGDQADQRGDPEEDVLVFDLGEAEGDHCCGLWRNWQTTRPIAAQIEKAAAPSAQPALTSLR